MEHSIKYIKYEVIEDSTIITSGECPVFFLNSLTDVYCDFMNSPYKLNLYYNNKVYTISSPKDFHVQ